MGRVHSVQLTDEQRDAFLDRGGTGVISFLQESDEPPYALPVSYGYEPTEAQFYFRLAFGPDTGKEGRVDDGTPVTFVVYDETDDGWKSVVASGELEEVDEESLDPSVGEAMRQIEIPLVDVFERDPREMTFRFFRLDPDELTGRKEARNG